MVNESDVDLSDYLNTMNTPGMDDSPDMKVNPVMLYVVERRKKEEKLKAALPKKSSYYLTEILEYGILFPN